MYVLRVFTCGDGFTRRWAIWHRQTDGAVNANDKQTTLCAFAVNNFNELMRRISAGNRPSASASEQMICVALYSIDWRKFAFRVGGHWHQQKTDNRLTSHRLWWLEGFRGYSVKKYGRRAFCYIGRHVTLGTYFLTSAKINPSYRIQTLSGRH